MSNKPTDFNDLMVLHGAEAVRKQIQEAALPQENLIRECEANAGACYRQEHIEGLRQFKERDKAGYMSLRSKLKKLGVGITELERDLKDTEKAEGGKELNHLAVAKRVITKRGLENILYDGSFIWAWNNKGVWKKIDDREIRQEIHEEVNNRVQRTRLWINP